MAEQIGMQKYRAPSLFQPHRAREALQDAHNGKIPPLVGFYFGLSSVQVARFVAPLGYDMVWIDWEHSSCHVETMTDMVHAVSFMSEGKTIPFVRIPGHDHASIGFALDAGASIVLPQVDTVEQAKHIISASKFGAIRNGTRSAPPFRLTPGFTDQCVDPSKTIWENINNQAAIMIQIESEVGINNLDDILTACPEIDCVWLGSLDLRISMGMDRPFGPEPEFMKLRDKFHATVKKHNKPCAGLALGDEQSQKMAGDGRCMVVSYADVMALLGTVKGLSTTRSYFPAKDMSTKTTKETQEKEKVDVRSQTKDESRAVKSEA